MICSQYLSVNNKNRNKTSSLSLSVMFCGQGLGRSWKFPVIYFHDIYDNHWACQLLFIIHCIIYFLLCTYTTIKILIVCFFYFILLWVFITCLFWSESTLTWLGAIWTHLLMTLKFDVMDMWYLGITFFCIGPKVSELVYLLSLTLCLWTLSPRSIYLLFFLVSVSFLMLWNSRIVTRHCS